MNYKPDEKDWMAYLYGEMDAQEKHRFDEYVLTHPEVEKELARLRTLRQALAGVEDKEVIVPPVFVGAETGPAARASSQRFWQERSFRVIAAVAASLLILMVAGKLTNTTLSVSPGEMVLSFGASRQVENTPPPASLSSGEVQQMIDRSLASNNAAVQASLEETQEKLAVSIRRNLAENSGKIDALVKEAATASQQQIHQYVDGLRNENMQQVKDYFQLTSTEQKKYIENLLVDFAKYLQQQRNDDLQLVQTRMNSIEQNTDIFKQETEQILSSIITTVGAPVSGERRN